ncbi:MAG TPA: hypothetical protein VFU21_14210 [Kofleriaceae bacterium]|nr:hypothetical protein [Kofleriaceae bacterium]
MPRTFPLPSPLAAAPRDPAPIAFGGGGRRLGQLRGNDFIVRRAGDFAALSHVPLGNPAGIGALADGSLVAIDAADPMRRASLVVRVPADGRRPTLHDGLVPEIGALRVFALPEADELACARPAGDRLYRLRLTGGALDLVTAARLRGERCHIMTSLADGSFVYASGARELVRAAFGVLPRRYAVSIEPRALLPGPGPDLVWLCGDELQLISLAEPMRPLVRRPTATDQVDVAAGGRRLAVLHRGARGATLVCYDDRTVERWRARLAGGQRWVACSAQHVAVASDSELDVFDARTGALVHSS